MRVISGTHRSRVLQQVESTSTRETKDRVKESIFNSINNYLYDAEVLDLFCGSGSLGIEALSRGAKHCVFNDQSRTAKIITSNNVKSLELENQSTLYNNDYKTVLTTTKNTFDVILLDPPYSLHVLEEIIQLIQDNSLLNKGGVIVILYGKEYTLQNNFDKIVITKTKRIGITNVSYARWR